MTDVIFSHSILAFFDANIMCYISDISSASQSILVCMDAS